MNIVIVINSLGRGGAERVGLTLARWFNDQEGIHSTVVALKESVKLTYSTNGIDFINLRNKHVIMGIRRIVKEKSANIVLTMDVPLCLFTVPALVGLRTKHIVSERNSPDNFSGKWITKVLSRWLMKKADGFVFQTKNVQKFYGDNLASKSVVIHNPLGHMSWSTMAVSDNPEVVKIISVGRLNKQKNQELLINAYIDVEKQIPNSKLFIWGEGSERAELEKLVQKNHLISKVFLPGATHNIFEKLSEGTIFVLSSDFEGLPNALMEAMAMGLPCISTDCPSGGPAELINNGKNGLLVPVKDKDAIVNAIIELIEKRDYALELGKEASKIRETHSSDVICGQWLAFFRSIIAK